MIALAVLASGCGASGNGLAVQGTSHPVASTAPAASSTSTTQPSHTDPCDPVAGCVTRRIPIGSGGAIAFDAGVLWVAAQPARGLYGTLIRIDAATGRRSGQPPPLPAAADRYKLAVGDGGLWLSGNGEIWEIDPTTGQPRLTVDAGAPVTGLVIAQGSVWAIAGTSAGSTVLKIDPADGHVLGRADLSPAVLSAITVADGSVWVADTAKDSVIRLDSSSLKVERVTPLQQRSTWEPIQLTVMFGKVLVYERGAVLGLYAKTGGLAFTEAFREQKSGGDMAGGGTSLWAVSGHGRRQTGAVLRLNPATGYLFGHPIPVGGRLIAMATGDGGVWVLDGARGLLFEIRPH
jgi:streptogramin lyase